MQFLAGPTPHGLYYKGWRMNSVCMHSILNICRRWKQPSIKWNIWHPKSHLVTAFPMENNLLILCDLWPEMFLALTETKQIFILRSPSTMLYGIDSVQLWRLKIGHPMKLRIVISCRKCHHCDLYLCDPPHKKIKINSIQLITNQSLYSQTSSLQPYHLYFWRGQDQHK